MCCSRCKTTKNLYRFRKYKLKDGTVKQQYVCRNCNTKKARIYRTTEKGKIATKAAVQKYEAMHPERRIAWDKCQNMQTRPCIVCGGQKTDKHHPDYQEPLKVVWLCRLHHKEAHQLMESVV